jgi:hypothetical protein
LVLRRAVADQIADDHQPGGDPDARLELSRFDIQPDRPRRSSGARPDRPLGIVLMRSRVAEIDQHTIALFSVRRLRGRARGFISMSANQDLRLDRARIERQCVLEQAESLGVI